MISSHLSISTSCPLLDLLRKLFEGTNLERSALREPTSFLGLMISSLEPSSQASRLDEIGPYSSPVRASLKGVTTS